MMMTTMTMMINVIMVLVYISTVCRLPDHLVVSWPNGMEVLELEKRPAGKTVGE